MSKDGTQVLADLVRRNRRALGLHTQADLADALGLTVKTVGNIERAAKANYSSSTLARLEQIFDWTSGTAEKILKTGKAPESATETAAPIGKTWSDFEEAWDSVAVDTGRVLRVFASYDPDRIDTEDLARIALNARHYMRKELDEASGTGQDSKPAPVSPFPARADEPDRVAAFDPRRHGYDKYGDEDEQTQIDP